MCILFSVGRFKNNRSIWLVDDVECLLLDARVVREVSRGRSTFIIQSTLLNLKTSKTTPSYYFLSLRYKIIHLFIFASFLETLYFFLYLIYMKRKTFLLIFLHVISFKKYPESIARLTSKQSPIHYVVDLLSFSSFTFPAFCRGRGGGDGRRF